MYGIALGIAERVLQGAQLHMPEAVHEASSIYWISSSGDLGSGATSLSIGDLSSGFDALAPELGSGGGGGGFSGGEAAEAGAGAAGSAEPRPARSQRAIWCRGSARGTLRHMNSDDAVR